MDIVQIKINFHLRSFGVKCTLLLFNLKCVICGKQGLCCFPTIDNILYIQRRSQCWGIGGICPHEIMDFPLRGEKKRRGKEIKISVPYEINSGTATIISIYIYVCLFYKWIDTR